MPNSRFQKPGIRATNCVHPRRVRYSLAMQSLLARVALLGAVLVSLLGASSGCTSVREYIYNGCKVGPNYHEPPAAVACKWIDAGDKRLKPGCDDLAQWWKVFNDPALDSLICTAYHQNLTLREAGFRILQARAQLGIARGEFFPQNQNLDRQKQAYAVRAKQKYSSRIGWRCCWR